MSRKAAAVAGLALGLVGCGSANGVRAPATPAPSGWTLAWSDEFDGAAGATVDTT